MRVMTASRLSVSYLAFVMHRLSGLALALFLPLHFLVLGLAIEGEARLDGCPYMDRTAAGQICRMGTRRAVQPASAARPARAGA